MQHNYNVRRDEKVSDIFRFCLRRGMPGHPGLFRPL